MNTPKPVRTLAIASITMAALSASLFAAFDFNPGGPPPQPAVTLAPYAVSVGNLADGNTRAYRPWFENGAWQGDLIEYTINEFGTESTDAIVGSNPALDGIASGGSNWMARARFDANETDPDYWRTGRNIFTYDGSSQVPFLWGPANLTLPQKTALDPDTDPDLTDVYSSPVLNFIRGDRSNDLSGGGILRYRFNLLGDIINSWPVYIGPPKEAFTITGFLEFKKEHAVTNPRVGRVAVGANDGMLHVFNAVTGNEAYAYIPSMLIGKLDALTVTPYGASQHTYFVDAPPTTASAQISGDWKTILTGGLGAGGKGLYALDVTTEAFTSSKVLFEKSDSEFGYIYGRPRIGRMADSKWYIFTGNGYDNGSGSAKLLIISLDTGAVTEIATDIPATGAPGGLSSPTLVDTNKDLKIDFVFAGDTNGNMWRFDLNTTIAEDKAIKIYAGDATQPITTAPTVGFHPAGGHMVYFGTGSVTSMAEATEDPYPPQAIYGIWDNAIGTTVVEQVLAEDSVTFPGKKVRFVPNPNTVNYALCLDTETECEHLGWKVVLPNNGERVIGPTRLRAGRVSVMTTNPFGIGDREELEGDSWLMSLNYLTGGHNDSVVIDLNGDKVLDQGDAIDLDGDPATTDDIKPPVGLNQGPGNIAQPSIARIGPGLDLFLVNGLKLPFEQIESVDGPFIFGHIDVETDSPFGGTKAPNGIADMSEGYQIRDSDGLGRAVDGHVHGYDTIHGITHVDLFELEPRRGLASLDARSVERVSDHPVDGCPDGSSPVTHLDGNKATVLDGCIDTVDAELNRAYDNLDLADLELSQTSATHKSEVYDEAYDYILNNGSLMDEHQAFIVVLANADRSSGGTLQIGCRTWDVVEYQDMITEQLIANTGPSSLQDTSHSNDSLVFTLAGIASENPSTCPEDSPKPTLRVDFSRLGIQNQGIHPTRSQCVLGLHDYRKPVDYWDEEVLCYAPKQLNGEDDSCPSETFTKGDPVELREPPDGYIEDPADNRHITRMASQEGTGFRWRNGALTVQLLAVAGDNTENYSAAYTLQPPSDKGVQYLPKKQGRYIGGIVAEAFTAVRVEIDGETVYVITADDTTKGLNESGLLHETTMYWHYGDLSDGVQRGQPSDVPCYGGIGYGGAFAQELRGLNFGQYADLFDGIDASALTAYDDAINALAALINNPSATEAQIAHALLELAKVLENNPDLSAYHKFRDYAPGVVPEDQLREVDKGLGEDEGGGGVITGGDGPNNPEEAGETATGLGNNFEPGRRTWIDLRP